LEARLAQNETLVLDSAIHDDAACVMSIRWPVGDCTSIVDVWLPGHLACLLGDDIFSDKPAALPYIRTTWKIFVIWKLVKGVAPGLPVCTEVGLQSY
jgi:hypothetical protein